MQPPVIAWAVAMSPESPDSRKKEYACPVAQTSVRMPDELLRRARDLAKSEGVSLNLWLCTAIAEKAAGSLRAEDRELLRALDERLTALEKRFR